MATACTAALLLAAPLPAAGAAAPARHPAARHRHQAGPKPPIHASITFQKNRKHPFHSRIIWRVYAFETVAPPDPKRAPSRVVRDGKRPKPARKGAERHGLLRLGRHHHAPAPHKAWRLVVRKSWRAGSGLGGREGTNGCIRNVGWLPNGTYAPIEHDDYWGSVVKGRAFYLGNHVCRNGTLREQLLIHTETGAGNVQCRDLPGDQHCRWETGKINDYRSNGCIKMAPGDLHQLVRAYHRYFRQGLVYPLRRFHVRIVG